MPQTHQWQWIPTHLTLKQFEEFVLPHLHRGSRGPQPKLSLHTIFNYILKLLYLGCQWKELPIEQNKDGQPEIHDTRIYSAFRRYEAQGCFDAIFAETVVLLHQQKYLDIRVIHGDETTTAAKKGGDNLGFSGHKHLKGDKVVAFCDRHYNVIAPFISAPGNQNESPLLQAALPQVSRNCQDGRTRPEPDHRQSRWGLRESGESQSHFQSGHDAEYSCKSAGQKDSKAGTQTNFRLGYFSGTVVHHRASVRLGG